MAQIIMKEKTENSQKAIVEESDEKPNKRNNKKNKKEESEYFRVIDNSVMQNSNESDDNVFIECLGDNKAVHMEEEDRMALFVKLRENWNEESKKISKVDHLN